MPTTPDASRYNIVDSAQIGNNLVLKVKYPNCSSCAFEGTKVMVYLGVLALAALKWKSIDPHFHDKKVTDTMAPSPAARFPATEQGWTDAINYASRRNALVE